MFITGNAAPNAVPAYRAMGFVEQDCEQCINGIRFIPMTYFVKPVKLVYPSVEYMESFIAANEEHRNMGEHFEDVT